MYQHVFQTQGVMHFESGKTPRVMRYVVSDDPHWASGYHMHENETELIWVERGTVEVMVNANKYVAHAGDIIALEHGKFHMLASSDADPAKTFTCAVYGFKFHDVRGESLILEPDSVPVVHAALGVDTIRTLFREFDTLVTQANPLVDILGNLIATLLTVLFRENFKLAARPGKDKQLKNTLIREVLVYLNENYREKITLEALSKRFRASVSYIAHEFAREYGVSPINYVIERRITEAKFRANYDHAESQPNRLAYRLRKYLSLLQTLPAPRRLLAFGVPSALWQEFGRASRRSVRRLIVWKAIGFAPLSDALFSPCKWETALTDKTLPPILLCASYGADRWRSGCIHPLG